MIHKDKKSEVKDIFSQISDQTIGWSMMCFLIFYYDNVSNNHHNIAYCMLFLTFLRYKTLNNYF